MHGDIVDVHPDALVPQRLKNRRPDPAPVSHGPPGPHLGDRRGKPPAARTGLKSGEVRQGLVIAPGNGPARRSQSGVS